MHIETKFIIYLPNGGTSHHKHVYDSDRTTGARAKAEVRAQCAKRFGVYLNDADVMPVIARVL